MQPKFLILERMKLWDSTHSISFSHQSQLLLFLRLGEVAQEFWVRASLQASVKKTITLTYLASDFVENLLGRLAKDFWLLFWQIHIFWRHDQDNGHSSILFLEDWHHSNQSGSRCSIWTLLFLFGWQNTKELFKAYMFFCV